MRHLPDKAVLGLAHATNDSTTMVQKYVLVRWWQRLALFYCYLSCSCASWLWSYSWAWGFTQMRISFGVTWGKCGFPVCGIIPNSPCGFPLCGGDANTKEIWASPTVVIMVNVIMVNVTMSLNIIFLCNEDLKITYTSVWALFTYASSIRCYDDLQKDSFN